VAKYFVALMGSLDFAAAVLYAFQGNARLAVYWAAAGVIAVCMYQ
jgi:hypothetical protein